MMFGSASILALVLALMLVTPGVLHTKSDRTAFAGAKLAADSIVSSQQGREETGVQSHVDRLSSEHWVAYCGVVSPEGIYTAHTKPGKVGTKCDQAVPPPTGIHRVQRLHHERTSALPIHEFWVPLHHEDQYLGALQIGVIASEDESLWHRLLDYAPQAVLAPLVILFLGNRWLRRTAAQNAEIEEQLCQVSTASSLADAHLCRLPEVDPASAGWNRLIEQAGKQRSGTDLESCLARAAGGAREQRAERILNGLPDGIAVTGKDRRVEFANRVFKTLIAAPESNGTGWTMEELLASHADRISPAVWEQLQQESLPVAFEVKRGAEIAEGVLRIARHPLSQDEGQTTSHVWSIRDVTQQKLAEDARNQFVSNATHELRTPLTNIKAYAESLALDEVPDVEQHKQFLNIINSEATRLARFVDELLNISRMESGALAVHRQETDTERLLNEVIEKVRPQMQQKQLDFEVTIPPKVPEIVVDKDKVVAAIINLLGNAAKYTPEGGRVALQVVVGARELQISIEDTGIGISVEELPKVFNKFFRSEDPRVRDIPGSGIGLSLVQEVARLHGGNLTVHSELNKGTKFTLTLPLA